MTDAAFSEQLRSYAQRYKVTPETDLRRPPREALLAVTAQLGADLTRPWHAAPSPPTAEEFFPEDRRFQRIAALTMCARSPARTGTI